MSEHCCGIQVGQTVPDFKLETYEPTRGDFGEISLAGPDGGEEMDCSFLLPRRFYLRLSDGICCSGRAV